MSQDTRFTSVGRIVSTHGLKGEVGLALDNDIDVDDLVGLDAWVVPASSTMSATRFVTARSGPKGPLVTLYGCSSIGIAQELRGREVLVRTCEAPEPAPYRTAVNPLGFGVTDERVGELGTVDEVIETGANDVWVVHGAHGEVLIPVIDDVVVEIDSAAERIRVKLLEGLLPTVGESRCE